MDNQNICNLTKDYYDNINWDKQITTPDRKNKPNKNDKGVSILFILTLPFTAVFILTFCFFKEIFTKGREANYKGVFRKRDAFFIIFGGMISLTFILGAVLCFFIMISGGNLGNDIGTLVERFGVNGTYFIFVTVFIISLLIFIAVRKAYGKVYARCPNPKKKHSTILFNMYIIVGALQVQITSVILLILLFTPIRITVTNEDGEAIDVSLNDFDTCKCLDGNWYRVAFSEQGQGFIENPRGLFEPAFVNPDGQIIPPW
ncbi:MAG: hypothetical protein FWH07_05570 [Oscillospiraceae bacterium]|nr:hypothetical protein [Oscillospiraceae bacterium]